ncbi:MAG: hypothetical protein HRT66_07425 [Flavobacteriaceae bacterium]|nr:hypothetical protein [Flavobacteriaceae bacterium]
MNKLIKFIIIVVIVSINTNCVFSQDIEKKPLKLTKEEIVYYKYPSHRMFNLKGFINDKLLFVDNSKYPSSYTYNEVDFTFNEVNIISNMKNNKHSIRATKANMIVYSTLMLTDDDDEYEIIYLNYKNKTYKLDKVEDISMVEASFSDNLKHLTITTLPIQSGYHIHERDDKIRIYNIENIDKGEIKKEFLPIKYPSNGMIVNRKLFFQKVNVKSDDLNDLWQTDIYKTTPFNLKDTIKVASFSKIKVISPDGKYILGSRNWDIPNGSTAIFNVETGKYQLLIGREYHKATAFYSIIKEKFGFDFKGKIVYIDIPKEFPYDSFQRDNLDLPDFFDVDFYKKHKHKPFKDEL